MTTPHTHLFKRPDGADSLEACATLRLAQMAGEDLALILSGFLRREFGDQAVYLRPLSPALHNGGGR